MPANVAPDKPLNRMRWLRREPRVTSSHNIKSIENITHGQPPGGNGSIKHLAVIPLQYLRSEVIASPYTRFKVLKISSKSCVVNIEKKPCQPES